MEFPFRMDDTWGAFPPMLQSARDPGSCRGEPRMDDKNHQ